MDTKALAKSKRAHSQHHSKKHHPNQTSKAPLAGPVGASGAKKALGKQIKEKPHHSQGSSALPSNWDRYEEEYDLGLGNPSQGITSQSTDVIVPKSKGADYSYLISEAQTQSRTNSYSDDFPSFDDVFTDFNQGEGSLLSVRGKSVLLWVGDDSFVVEDKATASPEVSFLSLDLHALAEQLAKVDLSQRLFIEADLLPPEMCTGELQASCKLESGQDQATCGSEGAKKDSDESASPGFSDEDATSSSSSRPVPNFTNEGLKYTGNQVKDELWQFDRSGTALESETELNMNSVANPKKKPSRFKAEAAEAELDMLLDSFNDTKFLDSTGITSYASQEETSTSLLEGISSDQLVRTFPVKKGQDVSKSAFSAGLDDTIDDLLNETSGLMNQNGTLLAAPLDVLPSPSSLPVSRSKLLDDFDSWLDTI